MQGESAVREAVTKQIQGRHPDDEVVWAGSLVAALQVVHEDFDVMLAGLLLPDSSGIELVYRLLDGDDMPPLVLLTESDDDALCTEALRLGAQDFVSIESLSSLPRVLRLAVERKRLRSERRRQLGDLMRSEAEYRVVAENTGSAVVVDDEGRIAWANRSAAQLFGHSDEIEILDWLFPASLSDGDLRRIALRRSDGRTLTVRVRALATHWEGRPAILAALQDVTETRREEDARLSSQRLSVLTRVAGAVAHDFGPVLTGLAGDLKAGDDETAAAHPARARLNRLGRNLSLAEGLLGRMVGLREDPTADREPLDVNETIDGLSTLFQYLVGDQARLDVHAQPHLGSVLADRSELEQVLLILVANARDAVGEDGVIRVRATTPMRGRVAIVVEDDGVGMDVTGAARAREAFYTTKSPASGPGRHPALGLGLTTATDILGPLGGTLKLFTTPNAGTTAWVEMPLAPANSPPVEPEPEPEPRLDARQAAILVVDDDPVIRSLLQDALARAGHRVLVADSGPAAIQRVLGHSGPLDLLLTDLVMPEINGIELAAQLHKIRPALPVLYVSGEAERFFGDPLKRPDGVNLLRKPFRMAEAIETVAEILADEAWAGGRLPGKDWDGDSEVGLPPIRVTGDDLWSSNRDSDSSLF